jgi:hypothetical protein
LAEVAKRFLYRRLGAWLRLHTGSIQPRPNTEAISFATAFAARPTRFAPLVALFTMRRPADFLAPFFAAVDLSTTLWVALRMAAFAVAAFLVVCFADDLTFAAVFFTAVFTFAVVFFAEALVRCFDVDRVAAMVSPCSVGLASSLSATGCTSHAVTRPAAETIL